MSEVFFAAVAPRGWIWPDTTRHRAKHARKALGEIFVGMRFDGEKIADAEEGYAHAFKQGYRIRKVRMTRIDEVPL